MVQVLPSPLILKPLSKAEYFEVGFIACSDDCMSLALIYWCLPGPVYMAAFAVLCLLNDEFAEFVLQKRQPFSLWGMLKSPYGLMVGMPPAYDTDKHRQLSVSRRHSMPMMKSDILRS